MLTVLGGLAEFERELIKSRTSEGRKRARERGQAFGPKPKLTPFQRQEAFRSCALRVNPFGILGVPTMSAAAPYHG